MSNYYTKEIFEQNFTPRKVRKLNMPEFVGPFIDQVIVPKMAITKNSQ